MSRTSPASRCRHRRAQDPRRAPPHARGAWRRAAPANQGSASRHHRKVVEQAAPATAEATTAPTEPGRRRRTTLASTRKIMDDVIAVDAAGELVALEPWEDALAKWAEADPGGHAMLMDAVAEREASRQEGGRMMINKQTAMDIALAYREVETSKLLAEIDEASGVEQSRICEMLFGGGGTVAYRSGFPPAATPTASNCSTCLGTRSPDHWGAHRRARKR